VLDAMSKSA
jgi:putative transposase